MRIAAALSAARLATIVVLVALPAALAHQDCDARCGHLDYAPAAKICYDRCEQRNAETPQPQTRQAAPETCKQPLWVNGQFRGYWDPCAGDTLQFPYN